MELPSGSVGFTVLRISALQRLVAVERDPELLALMRLSRLGEVALHTSLEVGVRRLDVYPE